MDLADGYYALGIRKEDRDFFTVNYRGELWRLARLPMGWTCSSYYFCKLTVASTDYMRTPMKRRDQALPPTAPSKPTRRFLRNTRWRGERLLPYMDDFLFLADSREAALELRVRLNTSLDRLGLLRNPNKGVWEPTQVGPHLGLIVDLQRGEFRAPEEKLIALAKVARSLLGRAASNRRWLPARLASFVGKAKFLYMAITPARFFLRELHCVLATRQGWGGRVKMTNQLRRDLECAYKARSFWYEDDRAHHIMWKKLRAVRHAVESFLPQLRGRRVLKHEDNTAVVAALANHTSRPPVMMEELRKLWHLMDIHDISIRPRPGYGRRNSTVYNTRAAYPTLDARYRLAVRPGSEAPWTASMAAELRSLLGTDDVGQAALGLLTGSLASGTYRNYDSGMRSFATFCEQEGLRPLHATTITIVRYTPWLGMQDVRVALHAPVAADILDTADFGGHSRDAYCRCFYGASPPPKFWSISPLESSATWSVSATLTEWLREAYLAAGARPPTGFKWTSHSLRKCAASAASCVGVPLPAITHMGDWSKNSDVVTGKYTDPTMRPTHAAWWFFGWLVPVRPPA
eukprot:jgi/Tetstr1/453511/TSEL_040480.t1